MTSNPCEQEHADLLEAIKQLNKATVDCEPYLGVRLIVEDESLKRSSEDHQRVLQVYKEAFATHREKNRALVTCLQAHPAKSGRR